MKRKKITKWIPLLLFVLLFGIVDFLLKGYCIELRVFRGREQARLFMPQKNGAQPAVFSDERHLHPRFIDHRPGSRPKGNDPRDPGA